MTTTCRRSFLSTLAGASAGACLSQDAALAATLPRPAGSLPFYLGNQTSDIVQYKGKVFVLEALLTTCSHCQRVAQVLDHIYREKAAAGFQVLGLAINDNPDVPGFVQKFGISFPVGTVRRDLLYIFFQVPIMTQRVLMPQVAMVDRGFVIQSQYGGDDPIFSKQPDDETQLRAIVNRMLAPNRPPFTTAAPGTRKGVTKKK
jgi:hypothetical protein